MPAESSLNSIADRSELTPLVFILKPLNIIFKTHMLKPLTQKEVFKILRLQYLEDLRSQR